MNSSTASLDPHDERMQVPYALRAVFSVALFAVALVSVTGNLLEVITFVKTQNLRTSTNYYITSMAVSDLLLVVSNCTLHAKSRLSMFEHSMSSFVCILGFYLSSVSYSVSIESLTLITVDRFIATVFPMKVTMITGRIRAVCILLSWIVPLGLLYRYLQFARNAEEFELPYLCVTDMNRLTESVYFIVGFVILYFVPLIIITILNFRILKSLRRTKPVIQGNSQSKTRRRERNQRVMKILISINVAFFICWSPSYVITAFFLYFSNDFEVYILEMLEIVCNYFLPLASTAFNPVIIFTFSTNFRQGLMNCLRLTVVNFCPCPKLGQALREAENVELPELHGQWLLVMLQVL